VTEDGKVEVRGVVAVNGRGEMCFFAHSRADGVPLLLGPRALRDAVYAAPARRITHDQLAALDPVDPDGEERRA
jgi:hypothetical protein